MKKIVFALLIALLVLTACEQPKACTHSATETKVITAATCTENGENAIVCKSCGETLKIEVTSVLEHDYIVETMTPATCKDEGLQVKTCKRCTVREEITLPKTNDHTANGDPVEIITAPTCTEPGKGKYICGVCGVTFEGEIAAKHGETIRFYTPEDVTAYTDILLTSYCKVCRQATAEPVSFGAISDFPVFDSSDLERGEFKNLLDDIINPFINVGNTSLPSIEFSDSRKAYTYSGEITGERTEKVYSLDFVAGADLITNLICFEGTLTASGEKYDFTLVSKTDSKDEFFAEVNGIKGLYTVPPAIGDFVTVFGKSARVFHVDSQRTLAFFIEPLEAPAGGKDMEWGSYGFYIDGIENSGGSSATCSDKSIGAGAVNTVKAMADPDAFKDKNGGNNTIWQALKNFREYIGDTDGKVFIPSVEELLELVKNMSGLTLPADTNSCWSSSEYSVNQAYDVGFTGSGYVSSRSLLTAVYACVEL